MITRPMRTMRQRKNRNAIGDVLGNVIGEKGVKTDVSVKLTPSTVPLLMVTIIISVAAAILLAGAAKKAMGK